MVTIIDVANAAGVAPSTVSYVLSGKRPISPPTRRVVEEAIRELGYRRHGGRAPARGRTGVLAVVSSPLSAEGAGTGMEIFAAISAAARSHGLDLLLVADERGPEAMHRLVSGAVADAVIVGDVEPGDPRLPVLLCSSLPAIVIGSAAAPGFGCVVTDLAAGSGACAAHLAGLGHRSVAYLDRIEGSLGSRMFRHAFAQAAAKEAMNVVARPCAPSPGGVRRGLEEMFAGDRPTALVVHHTIPWPLVLSALDELGLRMPQDVSVVALGPRTATHHGIPLTTVTVAPQEIGAAAVASAVRLLAGPAPAETHRLPGRLVVRGSTVAPPRHASGPPVARTG